MMADGNEDVRTMREYKRERVTMSLVLVGEEWKNDVTQTREICSC
jgi:hypothetical protein